MPVKVSCPTGFRPEISVTPLGAGQDVGRSCILVRVAGKHIMLDCGMHMGYSDERRFPDFTFINEDAIPAHSRTSTPAETVAATASPGGGNNSVLTDHIDCVIISHFHLDHCGALPYMTEMIGYHGPIYMTYPTKAITPILLEDMRRVSVERNGETNFFTSAMIKECMRKVIPVSLHQVVQVDDQIEIKAYYAGHVLGAAMFHISVSPDGQKLAPLVGNSSVRQQPITIVYTGDYNMTPDRHLGAAWIDRCEPDLLISESTYATTIRDSKRCREGDFLKKVHECVDRGGKVLIPVFALGRAQELCILLETFWERMNLTDIPIYFSAGMTERANHYYKLFIAWTNEKIKRTFVDRNMFDFKHIKPLERSYINNPGPMVVFATPGMLHGGLSLAIFEEWCGSEANMIVMPGYCVAGTVGNKILNGQRRVEVRKGRILDVRLSVQYMSFSAHADAKGILQLIDNCRPKNVLLVHGEGPKMEFLKGKILEEFADLADEGQDVTSLQVYMPANGQTAVVQAAPLRLPVFISNDLVRAANVQYRQLLTTARQLTKSDGIDNPPRRILRGLAVMPTESASKKKINADLMMATTAQSDSISIYSASQACQLLSTRASPGADEMAGATGGTLQPLSLRFTYNLELADESFVVDSKALLDKIACLVCGAADSGEMEAKLCDRSRISVTSDDDEGECELSITTPTDCVLLKLDLKTDNGKRSVVLSWAYQDESVGSHMLDILVANLPLQISI